MDSPTHNRSEPTAMIDASRYAFGDDSPKTDPDTDDRLGFAPFAERLANTITALSAPNGYVIGLLGAWGSGKSTVLNFVAEYIRRFNIRCPDKTVIHISFRPWIITGHHDLISAFFKILSEQLQPNYLKKRNFLRRALFTAKDASPGLIDAAAKVAIALDPSAGVATRFGGDVAKKSLSSLLDNFLAEPSLQSAYEDLKCQLQCHDKRFLVTIDDIDRLEEADIRCIMRMVKSIGQLPNVIYFLSYDRYIVWNALRNGNDRVGPEFAEKIVQQEVELPRPRRNTLLKMLDKEIDFFLGSIENSHRWQALLRAGVQRWMQSPRDVVRLSNAIKFSWPALFQEIDQQDLLTAEGLRLFDPEAFRWLQMNREFLFRAGRFSYADKETVSEEVRALEQFIPEGKRSQVLEVMEVLFPQIRKPGEIGSFLSETHDDIVRRRGIGCEAGYDTFFSLYPSEDAIPLATLRAIIYEERDTESCEDILRQLMVTNDSEGIPLICALLEELRVRYHGSRASSPRASLFRALFRTREEIIGMDDIGRRLVLTPHLQMQFVVRDMVKAWGEEEGGRQLVEVFEEEASVAMLSDVYVDRGREFGVFHASDKGEAIISRETFETLGELLKEKIESAYEEQTLADAPFYFDIARAWSYLAGEERVRRWLNCGATRNSRFMAKVSIGLVAYSESFQGRHYRMHEKPTAGFYDLEALLQAARLHQGDLTLHGRRAPPRCSGCGASEAGC